MYYFLPIYILMNEWLFGFVRLNPSLIEMTLLIILIESSKKKTKVPADV